jgi:hypothetical protein
LIEFKNVDFKKPIICSVTNVIEGRKMRYAAIVNRGQELSRLSGFKTARDGGISAVAWRAISHSS